MPDVHRVFVQAERPDEETGDPGAVAVGYYTVTDGELVMTDAAGKPITDQNGNQWRRAVEPGSERVIAGRLVRAVRARLGLNKRQGFDRRIDYPRSGVA